jgi:FKBP-type peptidyl-prolyl cis-trans isomerase
MRIATTRIIKLFAPFLGVLLLAGPVLAQPNSGAAAPPGRGASPAPAASTDPALSPQANAAFLAENAKKPGVNVRPSGLQYKIIRNGFGKHPAASDTVEVYYTGTLINGKVFDGTSPGLPAAFNITASGLVQGWKEVLQLMRVGDHWQVFVPANLGYGSRGSNGGAVPPNQTIIFDLRLLSADAPKRGEPGYVPTPEEEQQKR